MLEISRANGATEPNHWNISNNHPSTFYITIFPASREAAFVYSISSAGVVHAITRACSRGDHLNCACDPMKLGECLEA